MKIEMQQSRPNGIVDLTSSIYTLKGQLGYGNKSVSMGNQIKIGWTASNVTGMDALTDDLLELVLLRLNSPVCLVRAAATCRLWRRVIADAGFLRRVRHLHRPPVLGYYLTSQDGGATFFVDLAGELHGTTDSDSDDDDDHWFSFSLDFLPVSVHKLLLADSRGGLLAFTDKYKGVMVCNPLTSEYEDIGLPTEPEDDNEIMSWCTYISAFLLDATDDDDDEMDPSTLMWRFRVLYVRVQHHINTQCAQVYVFSARDDRWFLLSTTGANVLTLDECTGEFSVLMLPEPVGSDPAQRMQYHRGNLRSISGDAHAVRLVRIVGNYLEVLSLIRDGGTCVVDKRVYVTTILFPHSIKETRLSWNFVDTALAAGPACVVLLRDYWVNMFMFSIETMRLVHWSGGIKNARVFPHELPWPPTIEACLYRMCIVLLMLQMHDVYCTAVNKGCSDPSVSHDNRVYKKVQYSKLFVFLIWKNVLRDSNHKLVALAIETRRTVTDHCCQMKKFSGITQSLTSRVSSSSDINQEQLNESLLPDEEMTLMVRTSKKDAEMKQENQKMSILFSTRKRKFGLVVAIGSLVSRDSTHEIGGTTLGGGYFAVAIHSFAIVEDERLPRPYGDIATVEDAIGMCLKRVKPKHT
ncbi:hypothetical protein EJB05_50633, partial [Eragrostis curvula]